MLDIKDLEAIADLIDKRITITETKFEEKLEEKLGESENLLLEEMDRLQKNMEKKIDLVQTNLDELNAYYRITRLENDNTKLLLHLIEELRKDVDELKKATA